jgi:hypothetical protein
MGVLGNRVLRATIMGRMRGQEGKGGSRVGMGVVPVVNPLMTGWEMKWMKDPRLKMPMTVIRMPVLKAACAAVSTAATVLVA